MKDSVIIKSIIFYCIISLALIYSSIYFFLGINGFNHKPITTKNAISKILATKILPLILILGALWLSGAPILDYITKDYRTTQGVLTKIKSPYKDIANVEFYIEGDRDPYYLPRAFIIKNISGTRYEFVYGRRSRIIIKIGEVE